MPDSQEVVERHVMNFGGSFNMDDTIVSMGVHPVKTTVISGNTNTGWDSDELPIDIDGEMDVNMVVVLLHTFTGYTADRRM